MATNQLQDLLFPVLKTCIVFIFDPTAGLPKGLAANGDEIKMNTKEYFLNSQFMRLGSASGKPVVSPKAFCQSDLQLPL